MGCGFLQVDMNGLHYPEEEQSFDGGYHAECDGVHVGVRTKFPSLNTLLHQFDDHAVVAGVIGLQGLAKRLVANAACVELIHDGDEVRHGEERIDEGGGVYADARFGTGFALDHLFQFLHVDLEEIVEKGVDDVVFALEIPVECAFGQPRFCDDVVHARLVDPFAGEHRPGGDEDLLASFASAFVLVAHSRLTGRSSRV